MCSIVANISSIYRLEGKKRAATKEEKPLLGAPAMGEESPPQVGFGPPQGKGGSTSTWALVAQVAFHRLAF